MRRILLSLIVLLAPLCQEALLPQTRVPGPGGTAPSGGGGHTAARVNFKHVYPATSGTGVSLGFAVSAGDLLVIGMSGGSGTITTNSVSDNLNGAWTCFTVQEFNSTDGMEACYFLGSAAGTPTVTPTLTGTPDFGWTVVCYHQTAGTWSKDSSLTSGSFKSGSTVATTTTPTTSAWSTAGTYDVIVCLYADETTGYSSLTAGANFTAVQADLGHADGQEEWIGAAAQTAQTASWTQNVTSTTWGLFVVAFSLS